MMATQQKGTVTRVSAKPWNDTTLYSFQTNTGGSTWFRTGEVRPPFKEGQSVSFTVNEKNQVKMDTLEVGQAQVAATQADKSVRRFGAQVGKDEYWANKEAKDIERDKRYQTVDIPRMTFCSAQDAAVELLGILAANGAIPEPKNKADKMDVMLDILDTLSTRLFEQRFNSPHQPDISASDASTEEE